ncbi:MAG: PocR ligand-binding domain-containing protein [Deltaproteobacteria bacterium]|nr:PocR ligand-binding domain-containing protein [Deltaproteobacteria bacterium]
MHAKPPDKTSELAPLKIAAIYAVVGCLWILASDRVLALLIPDAQGFALASTYKGWIYVVLTALLIYGLVRAALLRAEKAQTAVREGETRFRLVMDQAVDLMFLHDDDGRILDANQAAVDILAYRREELLGMRIRDLDPYAEAERHRELWWSKLPPGGSQRFDTWLRRKDGSLLAVEVNLAAVEMGGKRLLLAVARDITERKRLEADLSESRRFLTDLIENSGALIFVKDLEGRYQLVNRKWEEVCGLTRREVLGRTDAELFPGEIGRHFRENDLEVLRSGEVVEKEETLESPHGQRFFISIKFPVKNPAGGIIGTCGMTTEITERKRAEEALEKRLIALSRPLDDPAGLVFQDLFNLEDIQHIQDLFARATGVASIITHPDGTPLTRPSNFCRLCKEVIRKTEKGLRNCYASDALLGRQNPAGPLVQPCLSGGLWDAGASITVGGQHLANWLIGQVRNDEQSEEAMRRYAREIGADEEEILAAFREVPTMPEEQFRRVADALFALANQHSTVAYQNVQQARFITERKWAEAEKARMEAQLLQAQKMEAIGTLAGGIAHDFNNILGAILGYAEIAKDDAQAGRCNPRDLDQILIAAERAKNLVKQILTFSRKVEPERRPLNLNQEVGRAMELLSHTLPKMISTKLELDSHPRLVFADPGQLSQVILNLAANAAQAMPEGGQLTIATGFVNLPEQVCVACGTRFAGDWVTLQVSDTGRGIDAEDLPRVFDPFFTTKEVGQGTGLGLSMVHGIVQSHGGHIGCLSEPGQGATFTIFLAPYRAENFAWRGAEALPPELPGGHETLLLVDDEAALLTTARHFLESVGYQVLTTANGEEALEIYGEDGRDISLVILDLGMPGMGGHKTLQALRRQNPQARVLVASGYGADERAKGALADGAVGYVGKPFLKAELLTQVRQALDRA